MSASLQTATRLGQTIPQPDLQTHRSAQLFAELGIDLCQIGFFTPIRSHRRCVVPTAEGDSPIAARLPAHFVPQKLKATRQDEASHGGPLRTDVHIDYALHIEEKVERRQHSLDSKLDKLDKKMALCPPGSPARAQLLAKEASYQMEELQLAEQTVAYLSDVIMRYRNQKPYPPMNLHTAITLLRMQTDILLEKVDELQHRKAEDYRDLPQYRTAMAELTTKLQELASYLKKAGQQDYVGKLQRASNIATRPASLPAPAAEGEDVGDDQEQEPAVPPEAAQHEQATGILYAANHSYLVSGEALLFQGEGAVITLTGVTPELYQKLMEAVLKDASPSDLEAAANKIIELAGGIAMAGLEKIGRKQRLFLAVMLAEGAVKPGKFRELLAKFVVNQGETPTYNTDRLNALLDRLYRRYQREKKHAGILQKEHFPDPQLTPEKGRALAYSVVRHGEALATAAFKAPLFRRYVSIDGVLRPVDNDPLNDNKLMTFLKNHATSITITFTSTIVCCALSFALGGVLAIPAVGIAILALVGAAIALLVAFGIRALWRYAQLQRG